MIVAPYFITAFIFWLLIHSLFRFLSYLAWGKGQEVKKGSTKVKPTVMQHTNFIISILLFMVLIVYASDLKVEDLGTENRLLLLLGFIISGVLYTGLLPNNERRF